MQHDLRFLVSVIDHEDGFLEREKEEDYETEEIASIIYAIPYVGKNASVQAWEEIERESSQLLQNVAQLLSDATAIKKQYFIVSSEKDVHPVIVLFVNVTALHCIALTLLLFFSFSVTTFLLISAQILDKYYFYLYI